MWIYELSGTTAIQRLTFGGNNRFPIWSFNSPRVAFQSDREGDLAIFWQPVVGEVPPNASRSPIRATHMRRSRGLQRPTGCCSALRRGPTCRCGRSRCRTGRQRRSARSTRGFPPALGFRPMDNGWPTRGRNAAQGTRSTSSHSHPPGPSISSSRKGPTSLMKWLGHQTERNCSTIRGSADSRPSA